MLPIMISTNPVRSKTVTFDFEFVENSRSHLTFDRQLEKYAKFAKSNNRQDIRIICWERNRERAEVLLAECNEKSKTKSNFKGLTFSLELKKVPPLLVSEGNPLTKSERSTLRALANAYRAEAEQ